MIDNVYAGIKTRYDSIAGATLKALVTGGIWAEQAPSNCAMPYIVVNLITDVPEDTYTEEIEFLRIQFTVWHNNMNAEATGGMKAIYEAFRALYDDATLTVTGWTNFSCRWLSTTNLPTEDKVLGRAMDYEIYIET